MDGMTAAGEQHRLRPVDFRSPPKMAREHVRSLELTHEVFARPLHVVGQLVVPGVDQPLPGGI